MADFPPPGTPAYQAFIDQGTERYPGPDHWVHPRKDLPVGTFLAQFDHRKLPLIKAGKDPVSSYFTDEKTVMKHLTAAGEINARDLAETLQVGPFRPPNALVGKHVYSSHVAIYRTTRVIPAASMRVAQAAEFTHGRTRNNVQYGPGEGPQIFLTAPQDTLLRGVRATMELAAVFPCVKVDHRLDWLQKLEGTPTEDAQIKEAIKMAFEHQVKTLLTGTPQEKKHGEEIAKLYETNQRIKQGIPNMTGTKMPTPTPSLTPAVTPKKRFKGPRH